MNLIYRLKPTHLMLISKISETKKLQEAVDFMGMSQPAGSRILAEIELEIGASIFQRTPKGMELTLLGESFLKHARIILAELENLEKEIEHIKEGTLGELNVGAVTGPALKYVMPAVRKLSPKIDVNIEVGTSRTNLRRLDEGYLEFTIGRIPEGTDTRGYQTFPIRTEMVEFIVSSDHPIAGQANVTLAQMKEYPWVVQDIGNPIRRAVEEMFQKNKSAMPNQILNSSSLLIALDHIVNFHAIAPQTQEVIQLLTQDKLAAKLIPIDTKFNTVVPTYFLMFPKNRSLSKVAQNVVDDILANI